MASILTAKLIALPATFLLTGYQTSFSQNALPLLFPVAPSISTPLFTGIYHQGTNFVVPTAVAATAAWAYLAYTSRNQQHRRLYATAAVLTVAILPLTGLVMMPGIQRLIAISKQGGKLVGLDREVEGLLRQWTRWNWLRVMLTCTGGMVGLWAALS